MPERTSTMASANNPSTASTPLIRESGTRPAWIAVIAAGITFAACYLRNFVFPHASIMLWADQLLYATNGFRLISGQMPYRDYFEFLPAGTDLTYALLFRIFGVSLWIPNLLMDLLASAAVFLTTLAATRVLRSAVIALPAIFALG